MNIKRNGIAFLLCLVLCVSLISVAAFADETQVIVFAPEAAAQQQPVVVFDNADTSSVVLGSEPVVAAGMFSQTVIIAPEEGTSVTASASAPASSAPEAVVTFVAEGLQRDLLVLANQARNENGLSALSYSAKLQAAADTRAEESASSFHHARPDGTAAETVIPVDYTVTGENLIKVDSAYATAELMMQTWMNSQTHRANLLNAAFRQMAVGVYEAEGITYVSLVFTD